MNYDVFISHASEDKLSVARPLASQLKKLGLNVWIDEFELTVGDSLRREIDKGLSSSKFGVVILSRNFFLKEWPQKELDALVAREEGYNKVILPVWHEITKSEIINYSPLLADKLSVNTDRGIDCVAESIVKAIKKNNHDPLNSIIKDENIESSQQHIKESELKYYYYISKQKIEMIYSQLLDLKDLNSHNLVNQASLLIKCMEQHNLFKSLSNVDNFKNSTYFKDTGNWHHGLYGFQATGERIITYFLWRIVNNNLIILVGSPNNILGEKVVNNSVYVPGTSGALMEVLAFVKNNLSTDEPTAVTLNRLPFYGGYGKGSINTHSLAKGNVEETKSNFNFKEKHINHEKKYDYWESNDDYFKNLTNFWSSKLRDLPISYIETVFKVYSIFDNENSSDYNNIFNSTILATPLYVAIN